MSRLIAYVLAFLVIVCSSARVTAAQAGIGAFGIHAGVRGVHVRYCRYISVCITALIRCICVHIELISKMVSVLHFLK